MALASTLGFRRKKAPVEIGWAEMVDLPELGIFGIPSKIDTGARSSSIYGTHIRVIERDGTEFLRFRLRTAPRHFHMVEAPLIEQRHVTSSNGRKEHRYVIRTTLKIGRKKKRTDITISNRRSMTFPMLVGRRALRNSFTVNVARKYVLGHPA
ncbi:RimK/LysX family protein [Sphingorhabdus sp. Alg239-R122]|uniref:ATP-dependent zinc protease family protein n=1 Tax=Sphingorhabdus sp. Alg239-R122 TaxID=2305989 RepID=UPI0013DA04FD|nr:RimK/LysX family protein [Sphingorhabdus sp. Alg239-R122]